MSQIAPKELFQKLTVSLSSHASLLSPECEEVENNKGEHHFS